MPTTISGPNGEIRFGTGLPTLIIGERINPTGRKKFARQIASGDLSVIKDEAISQKNAGADVLDVNVGAAGVNEVALLPLAVKEALTASDLPICVDSANVEALKAALAVYPYKALINSVNGEERSLSSVLPIVKHYGAAVIALTIDENGSGNSRGTDQNSRENSRAGGILWDFQRRYRCGLPHNGRQFQAQVGLGDTGNIADS